MFTGDLTSEQGKQDYENYIMNNVRNEINSYTKQTQFNAIIGANSFSSNNIIPTGIILPFGGGPGVTPNPGTLQNVPDGWLLCSGAAVSRRAYSSLFTIIGTTYGVGDGSTTFNVPDVRGRVVAGKDYDVGGLSNRLTTAGSNIDGTAINASGGNQLLQQHLHNVTDPGHFHSVTDPGHAHNYYYNRSLAGYGLSYPNYGNAVYTNDYGRAMSYEGTGISIQSKVTGISIQNQGGGTTSSQNVQPTIILNYIIRT